MAGTRGSRRRGMEQSADHDEGRYTRLRVALIAILVILLILLISIVVFVSRLLMPSGITGTKTRDGELIWIRSIYGASAAAEDQFESPGHTAIGPDGTIWVTDSVKSRVFGFNPDGSLKRELDAGADGTGMLRRPVGVAVSEDGEVYVASNLTDLVIVWNEDGEVERAFPVPMPLQITVRDDRVFVTSAIGLYLFTTEGEQIAAWSSRGSAQDQVDLPNGAVIGPDGTLYIADTHNRQLKAFSPDGQTILWANPPASARVGMSAGSTEPLDPESIAALEESHPSTASPDAASGDLADTLQLPTGMTMDGAGRLVFVDMFSFAIYTADATTGKVTASYGSQGAADGQFNYPTGISYDRERDWFAVGDLANKRVQIVRIPDSGGSVLSAVRRVTFPWEVCAVPLALLIIAAMIAGARRRFAQDEDGSYVSLSENAPEVVELDVESADS